MVQHQLSHVCPKRLSANRLKKVYITTRIRTPIHPTSMPMDNKHHQAPIEVVVDSSVSTTPLHLPNHNGEQSILTSFHAGYFRISLSLCCQALIWKTDGEPNDNLHALRRAAYVLLWSLSLLTLASLSLLYILRCLFHFYKVKAEYLHYVGVNYLFAPWISWLLLLESTPFDTPKTAQIILWWVFTLPVVALDVKIYGQWFTKGKRFLYTVANPTSQISVLGNLVSARTAAEMGWNEIAVCLFSLGMAHYLVLFVTLYQRFSACDKLPAMLRPVFFLFFAAPSMASLAWYSISGKFDTASKMLFFLSLFLFTSLVSRPTLFRKSVKKFNVAWWAYSYTLTVLALASAKYAEEVNTSISDRLKLVLSALSVVVTILLLIFTALNTNLLLLKEDPVYK